VFNAHTNKASSSRQKEWLPVGDRRKGGRRRQMERRSDIDGSSQGGRSSVLQLAKDNFSNQSLLSVREHVMPDSSNMDGMEWRALR
jgi:hypothetical protein